jgi:hypothetical protein
MSQTTHTPVSKALPELMSLTNDGLGQLVQRLNSDRQQQDQVRQSSGSQLSVEDLVNRIEYVKMIISLWSHVCYVDGELAELEELSVGELMSQFMGSDEALFPPGSADLDAIFDELVSTFHQPFPLDEVVQYGFDNETLREVFFAEACCIVATDQRLHFKETDFLVELGNKLELSLETREQIKSQYINLL